MTEDEVKQAVVSIERRCRGPHLPGIRDEVNMLLAQGKTDLAAKLDSSGRSPCGYNVNELILAAPFDGQEHLAICPRCAQPICFVTPRVDE